MAKQYAYARVTQYGTIGANQTWSCGLALFPDQLTPINAGQLSTWLQAAETAFKLWFTATTGIGNSNSNDVKYIGVRAYGYASGEGKAISQADHVFTTPLLGLQSTGSTPTQTSLVVSTLTGNPGASFRGRRYLPATAITLTAHQVPNSTVDAICLAEKTLFDSLNALSFGAGTADLVVANDRDFPSKITSLKIDSEPDVQRRRADKILPNYSKVNALA